jgi:acyl-CoA thioesterase
MLAVFDVTPDGADRFSGFSDGGDRQVVDGTQLLAQAIVAAAKRLPSKSIRSAHAMFLRAADAAVPVEFRVEINHEGRSMAGVTVTVHQGARRCAVVTIFADTPSAEVIRHHVARPQIAGPADANPCIMPMTGRQIRLVDVADVNDPAEVGPPELYAWLHYDPIPSREDLAKALLAHFTGHLSISTTMRAHPGFGTSQAHVSLSTAVMTVTVTFHEPVAWDGWILYTHHSTYAGAGMSYVHGFIHTERGELIASFRQEGLIRWPVAADSSIATAARL